jgi:hypothetical protein
MYIGYLDESSKPAWASTPSSRTRDAVDELYAQDKKIFRGAILNLGLDGGELAIFHQVSLEEG